MMNTSNIYKKYIPESILLEHFNGVYVHLPLLNRAPQYGIHPIYIHCIYTELKKKLITHFSEYVKCRSIMSIKVYIFGEEIFCIIHLWSQIYSKTCAWKKSSKNVFLPKIALRRLKMLSMGQIC